MLMQLKIPLVREKASKSSSSVGPTFHSCPPRTTVMTQRYNMLTTANKDTYRRALRVGIAHKAHCSASARTIGPWRFAKKWQ